MRYIKQLGMILIISFIGEILNHCIPFPIPASIYGLVIMLACLKFKIIKIAQVKEVATFLIEIMPLMFIPAAVGLLDSWRVIQPVWFPIITITVVSTFLVMLVTGWTTQGIIRLGHKYKKKEETKNE